ncbi:MAG: transcriptional repressor [Gammaproteobacteria bacterium]|nr:MAG: transcriptional repressor [Gammaproteobacteria bacterium]
MEIQFSNTAEDMIRHTGARVTTARVRVLASLLKAGRALSHHEIASLLNRGYVVDRVTVYRVLEWLIRQRLAHKIPGDDRVWRFNVADEKRAGQHAHFRCNCCCRVFCLKDTGKSCSIRLPQGYRAQKLELTVKGLCAECLPGKNRHKPSVNKKLPCNMAKHPPARC